jgi:AcrR family transcriptional regulator
VRSAGRPRDEHRHRAVLQATRAVLAEDGYRGVTFVEVARRADATRQLLYRWWPNRASLVCEAVFAADTMTWPTDYPGPLAVDLKRWVGAIVDVACRPEVRAAIQGLMVDSESFDKLPGLQEQLIVPLRASFAALVRAGTTRGEIRPGIDVDLTTDTVRGAISMHLIADGADPDVVVAHITRLLTWALTQPDGGMG